MAPSCKAHVFAMGDFIKTNERMAPSCKAHVFAMGDFIKTNERMAPSCKAHVFFINKDQNVTRVWRLKGQGCGCEIDY